MATLEAGDCFGEVHTTDSPYTKLIIYIYMDIYIYMLPPPPSDLPFLGLFRPF